MSSASIWIGDGDRESEIAKIPWFASAKVESSPEGAGEGWRSGDDSEMLTMSI